MEEIEKGEYLVYNADSSSHEFFNDFSLINPRINKTFYYCISFFRYHDMKSDRKYEYYLNQEKKFLRLIQDAGRSDKLTVWLNFIFWIKSVINSNDTLRVFILLDKFTQTMKDEFFFYKEDEFIRLWLEYAQLCEDEIDVYFYMLKNGIFSNKFNVIEKVIDYYCGLEEFDTAKEMIDSLCREYFCTEMNRDCTKRKFYEILRNLIEIRIQECYSNTIIFPEVINKFIERNGVNNEIGEVIGVDVALQQNVSENENVQIQSIQDVEDTKLVKSVKYVEENYKERVEYLIRKYNLIKKFLSKYDEKYSKNGENENSQKITSKPFSHLFPSRLKPKLSVFLIMKVCDYLNLTEYYKNLHSSFQSSLVEYSILHTSQFPKKCKLELITDTIEKDCFEYMHKIHILAYTKYDKESYSTKITLLKYINNNFHSRSISFNYAVKNMLYLYGINENFLALFTPFYFILFDTRNLNFVHRHRFEMNHYSEENAVLYLNDYHPRVVAFSIATLIYITQIDTRNNVIIRNKLEGHRDDVCKLFLKCINNKNILVSASKTQIILWDLDSTNVLKLFAIDETKLLIKQIVLVNMNLLCIMTLYNQMYILEFDRHGDNSNNEITNLQVTNYHEDNYIYDLSINRKKTHTQNYEFVFKLNNNNLSIMDPKSGKELITYFDQESANFSNSDVIFIDENNIIKKVNKKNKIAVYTLY